MRIPAALTRFWPRLFIGLALLTAATWTLPRWWCGREGTRWFVGDAELTLRLAREVAATINRGVSSKEFTSDVSLFKHEWVFGTYQMGALGLLQLCIEHPEMRADFLPAAEHAIDVLLSENVRAFDRKSWREDPLESLAGSKGHAAYLGYLNLVLTLHRRIVPQSRFADLNNRISAALARRVRESAAGILYTYPGEAYPIDNASVLASLLMHEKYFGGAHADVTIAMRKHFQDTWREKKSGLLFQAIDGRNGEPYDEPRASGTALAAYFISFVDAETARLLFESLKASCAGSFLGFGFMREYPPGIEGRGDIDSGPVILGISPSATGFSIASARALGDRRLFVQLYRLAHLTGAPIARNGRQQFVTGGPLGNAILLAMLTAQPSAR
ncbi:MAG: hypothetical protein QM790_16695 [Nibricoccus sp.]